MRRLVVFLSLIVASVCLSRSQAAEPTSGSGGPTGRSAEVLARGDARWMSMQVNEPCILDNPTAKDRLVMFYSASNKYEHALSTIGKAWANTSNPFRWHQDFAIPIFSPAKNRWESGTLRIDCVLYIPEEDGLPGIRLATSDDGKTWTRRLNPDDPRKMGHIFESTPEAYYEWHQIFKVDDTYVLSIEAGVEHGKRWRPASP